MNNQKSIVEAIVFAAGKSVSKKEILDKLDITPKRLNAICEELKEQYSADKGGVVFCVSGDNLHFVTAPDVGAVVADVLQKVKERELSRSLLEVLSIIAYKQPITKLEIDDIRSSSSDYAITMLLKGDLIQVLGRKDTVGRPLLYGTTDHFLVRFQLSDIRDLPSVKEVQERISVLESQMVKSDELFPEKVVNDVDGPMYAIGDEIPLSEDDYEVDLSEVQLADKILESEPNNK